ncbi:hypothetical protein IQ13_4321 [Lacibacter cauensis]|uniref:Fimbrial assembly protein PilN n=1 Tax=Lacibacter cauensis TaxID=510947 RepID=A0A562S7U6_9BACT|nr:hypothetical protein [Lacibacter cauensis]TWI77515.1 hypothetical protein IQ13_4321 [Lacibacter cauensis]
MLAEFLKKKILYFRRAAAIEIIISENDDLCINMIIGEIRNNKIKKVSEAFVIDSIEKLAERIDSKTPVSVIINGKPVLVKEVRMEITDKNSNLVAMAFPEIEHSKFYSSVFKSEQIAAICIARKEAIDKIIERLIKADIKIYTLSIGIKAIENIFPFIEAKSVDSIETNWFKATFDEQKAIAQIEQKDTPDKIWTNKHEYLIGDQYIHQFTLLPFSALIELLAENIDLKESIANGVLAVKRKEFKFNRYFNIAGIGILFFLFAILFFNYILFFRLYSKNQELQLRLPIITGATNQSRLVQQGHESIINYIKEHDWDKRTMISYYADRIASLLPNNLTLLSLEAYPEKKGASNFSQTMLFTERIILLKGISPDPSYVNAFMNNLATLPGLETVKLKKYFRNKEKMTDEFHIELLIK